MVTTARWLITGWSSCTSRISTKRNFVQRIQIIWRGVNMEITARLLTLRKISQLNLSTTTHTMPTSTCSTTRLNSAHSTSQSMTKPSVSTPTTGRIIAESPTLTLTNRSRARTGSPLILSVITQTAAPTK